MATRPKSPCRHTGCRALLDISGYCDTHTKVHRRLSDDRRGTSTERGYNSRWQKARATYLQHRPFCLHCLQRAGIQEADLESVVAACIALGIRPPAATEVDHVIPHCGDQVLFWDTNNWQPLCKPCHSRKTASENGGYGNRIAAT